MNRWLPKFLPLLLLAAPLAYSENNDFTLGWNVLELCRLNEAECRAIMQDYGPTRCGPLQTNRRACPKEAVTESNFQLLRLSATALQVLPRLQVIVDDAAAKAGVPTGLLFGFLAGCDLENDSRFFAELLQAARIDFASGQIRDARISGCSFHSHWYKRTQERLRTEGIAMENPDFNGSGRDLQLLSTLQFWAQVLRTVLLDTAASPLAGYAEHPLLVFSLLNSNNDSRVFNERDRGSFPFVPTARAWLVAAHWTDIQRLYQTAVRPPHARWGEVSEHNFPFPEHARAELRLPNRSLRFYLRQSIPLYSRPDNCAFHGSREDIGSPHRQFESRQSAAIAEVGELTQLRNRDSFLRGTLAPAFIQPLEQSISCNEEWTLLRSSRGSLGWVKNRELFTAANPRIVAQRCFDVEAMEACRDEIAAVLGEGELISFSRERGSVEIKLLGFPELGATIDYRQFTDRCIDESVRSEINQKRLAQVGNTSGAMRADGAMGPWVRDEPRYLERVDNLSELEAMTPELRAWIEQKLSDMRAEFRTAALPDPLEFMGSTSPLLYWYQEMEEHCRPDCLISNRQNLQTFFNLAAIEKLSDISHFYRLAYSGPRDGRSAAPDRLLDIDVQPPVHTLQAQAERIQKLSLAEQRSQIEEFCNPLGLFSSKVGSELQRFYATLDQLAVHPAEEPFNLDEKMFTELVNVCAALDIGIRKGRGLPLNFQQVPLLSWQDFAASVWAHFNPNDVGRTEVLADLMATRQFGIREMPEDKFQRFISFIVRELDEERVWADDWLAERRRLVASRTGEQARSSLTSANECQYDPLASEARIRQLLALPCVAGVLVPNEKYFLQRFTEPRESGAFYPSVHFDRVEILLQKECL